ncbi:DNA annealing helicase and endonuclease ZRANB3-like, partial [Sinocyclocheilus anshuiensis]|uniref:DNA annealing helicase and endonuclease ZRANB3-like n=1 Tax=Sinocyclocheilus anshuiensis TaxID=1608454 RepID=UPI0007B808D1
IRFIRTKSGEFLAIRPGPLQIGGHKGGTAEPLQTVIRAQIHSGSCFLLVSGILSASRLVKRQHSSGAFIRLLTNSADILEDPYETFQREGEGEKERKGNAKLGGDGVKKKSARIRKGKAKERIRAPCTSSSLPDHPSSSSSLTTICISDSDQENEPATPSTPQTPHTRPNLQASPDVAETHMDESQETQRKNEFSSQTLFSGDPANDIHIQKESDDSVPVYDSLKFCASKNTDRIYIYDKDGLPLHCNFIPLDIRLQNWEELPAEFNHSENRSQVVRFMREWISLTAMRQRMVRKSGRVFHSPILLLEELSQSQRRHSSTSRYLSRQDVAQTSITVAQKEGGALRIIKKDNIGPKRQSSSEPTDPSNREAESSVCVQTNTTAGYLQAVDSAGTPLCLSCQKPSGEHRGWAGGFCSPACMEDFQLRSNQGYMRARVLETEQGVCQHCGLNAHQLYVQVRDAPRTHRKEMLDNTWLAQLPLKQLNEMIQSPVEGQFWQVDHINPVYRGGGQCSLENLQTLCTVCHRMRTAQQAKDRSQMKRDQAASKLASDITRFFIKK